MENTKEIVEAIKSINNRDWLFYFQVFGPIVLSIITFWVAYLTYKLQKRTKEDDDKERKLKDSLHINNVYYFLNDVINKLSDVEFEYFLFDNIVVEGKEYMDDINYLRNRYITHEDFCYLRELYSLYDGVKANPKQNRKNFKALYKMVMDTSLEPSYILSHSNNYDYITNINLLSIIKRLECVLDEYPGVTDTRVSFDSGVDGFCVKKEYGDGYYLEWYNGEVSGKIKRYEPVFHYSDNNITLVYELVYVGGVRNGLPCGEGKYYYYTSNNGFDGVINSSVLNKKGINYDPIAQEIRSRIISESPDGYFSATLSGVFDNGAVISGKLEYQLSPSLRKKSIKWRSK